MLQHTNPRGAQADVNLVTAFVPSAEAYKYLLLSLRLIQHTLHHVHFTTNILT